MHASRIGSAHLEIDPNGSKGHNNQDFYLDEETVKMVVDGCSGSKDSELGAKLFVKLFSLLPDHDNMEKFEENSEKVFDRILSTFQIEKDQELTKAQYKIVCDTLFFTLIACFDTGDDYVVKAIGDGFVITTNENNDVSYFRLPTDEFPSYLMYNYLQPKYKKNMFLEKLEFQTYIFSKKDIKSIIITSDGVQYVLDNKKDNSLRKKFERYVSEENTTDLPTRNRQNRFNNIFQDNSQVLMDDITIVGFGGEINEE